MANRPHIKVRAVPAPQPAASKPLGDIVRPAVISNDVRSIGRPLRLRAIRTERPYCMGPLPIDANRTLFVLMAQIRATAKDATLESFNVSRANLWRLLGHKGRPTKQDAERLVSELATGVFVVSTSATFAAIPYMEYAKVNHETERIELKLNKAVEPYLINTGAKFIYRKVHADSAIKLSTSYAFLAYVRLREFAGPWHRKTHRVDLVDMLIALQVPTKHKANTDFSLFERTILKPALEEIGRKTELTVNYVPVRDGSTKKRRGHVDALEFTVTENKALLKSASKALPSPQRKPKAILPIHDEETFTDLLGSALRAEKPKSAKQREAEARGYTWIDLEDEFADA